MKGTKIFARLFLSNSVIGLFAVLSISVAFYFLIRNALIDRTLDQLASVNTLKEEQIDSYFNQHKKDLQFLFTHDFFLEHFKIDRDYQLTAQSFPAEVGSEIRAIQAIYDFAEITVVNKDWVTVYSTSGDDFGPSNLLKHIPHERGGFHWIDASEEVGSGFTELYYAIPLHKLDHFLGFILVRENFAKVQRLLLENAGMGSTGESYLVGQDHQLRSASRFFPDKPPLTIRVDTTTTGGDHLRTDYRGVRVISFSRRLVNPELQWQIVSEIDWGEAMLPVVEFRNYLMVVTLLVTIVIVVISVINSNALSKPVLYLRGVISQLGLGVLPNEEVKVPNRDEIGQIALAVNQLVRGLKDTTEFARQIGHGNFDTGYRSLSDQDTLGLALIDMRDQLKNFNEREIKLVREKAAALLEGQENERKRIIQELHDGVGQLLTAIRLRVEITPLDQAQKKDLLDLINDTIAEVKRISYNVMPGSLVDFGLEAALKGLCDHTSRYSGLTFDFRFIRESDHRIAFDATIAVFRIVQEGINNILKHAKARHVELHVLDKDDEIYVLLKDDGIGFDGRETSGFGLRSMKERARLLNGSVDIHSSAADGTTVEVRIPLLPQTSL